MIPYRAAAGLFARSWRMFMAVLVMLSLALPAAAYDISIVPGNPVGYEPSTTTAAVPASFVVNRTGTDGTLPITMQVSSDSTAAAGDYVATWFNSDPLVNADVPLAGSVTFQPGESEIIITITPTDDTTVEGREAVVLTIVPSGTNAYNVGAPSSMAVTIADNDHIARIEVPDPIADEDSALFGLVSDPLVQRRAVMRVRFDQWPVGQDFDRNLTVEFTPTGAQFPIATLGSSADYVVRYKICGNNNVGTTSESSRIGYDRTSVTGTGLNYRLMAALVGEFSIPLQDPASDDDEPAIPVGSTIRFENDPTEFPYTVNASSPSSVSFNEALAINVPSGTKVIIMSTPVGTSAPENVVVERTYSEGATVLRVAGGFGGLYEGDVVQFEGDTSSYVIIADAAGLSAGGSSGIITIRRFTGGGLADGLSIEQPGDADVITHIVPVLVGNLIQVLIPPESTKVEIAVEPRVAGDGAEGVEEVRMRMIADEDYFIQTPQESSVLIADRDVTASIALQSNAGLPSLAGYFNITLSQPYSKAVTVPFLVTDSPSTAEGVSFTALPRNVTFVAGQTQALIQVDPIPTGTPADVTLTLTGTLNYKLGGSTSSSSNPSATMNISNSVGSVTIAATTPNAVESSTAPPSTNGLFTLSITRIAGQNGPVGVNLAVAGTAVNGSRYELFNPTTNANYSLNSGQIQVVIPGSGATSTTIGVRPINNFLADNNQTVQLSVVAGQSYSVSGAAVPASVTIVDDEPTISVAWVSDASRPSTAGTFRFSYPGVPVGTALGQAVVVQFTYGGTAALGTDFTASSTVTIQAGTLSSILTINPIDTADGSAETVSVTVSPDQTYNIGTSSANLNITAADAPSRDKPTPGTVNSGSSSGGCGLGSGLATLVGLGMFALLAFRRRQD